MQLTTDVTFLDHLTHLVWHLRAEEVELLCACVEEGVEVAVVAELGPQDAEHVRVVPELHGTAGSSQLWVRNL